MKYILIIILLFIASPVFAASIGAVQSDSATDIGAVQASINTAPTISSVTDYPDPTAVGSDVAFSVDWNDADEGDLIKIHICKEDGITGQTCNGAGSWCDSAGFTTDDPETCTYTTQSEDIGSNTYYAFVCDDDDECSASDSSTFTVEAIITPSLRIKGGFRVKGGWRVKF